MIIKGNENVVCPYKCNEFSHVVDTFVPYVRLPKPGAIPPLRPFRLFDSSFESPWRLYLHSTSLNLQIGVVLEILATKLFALGSLQMIILRHSIFPFASG